MKSSIFSIPVLVSISLLAACSDSSDTDMPANEANTDTAMPAPLVDSCSPDQGITYVCGLMNAEDLLMPGDTGMILLSGMNGAGVNGHLYLLNPANHSWHDLVTGPAYAEAQDMNMFAACPGPMDVDDFSAHGLALKETGGGHFDLYITSHGAREAIEVFDLDLGAAQPALTWKGCVTLDPAIMHNSVAILPDGGFVTTQFMHWEADFAEVFSEEPNGAVVAWHPGGDPEVIPGTELSGPNGILASEDGSTLYVAAFGSNELVRFDLSQQPPGKQTLGLDITPDNLRWGEPGMLLTAGNNASGQGWSVVEVDAGTFDASTVGSFGAEVTMQGISAALQVNDEIWVGTYSGDRIGYFPKP